MRFAYVLNPAAHSGRAGRRWGALAAALDAAGLGGTLHATTAPGDGVRRAREAARDADVVVAVGGDGTVHEVVNGLAGTDAAFGLLPMGTGNDFAVTLGVPRRLAHAIAVLASAPARAVDVGLVRWQSDAGGDAWQEKRFANGLGVGFDALAALGAARYKRVGGRTAYVLSVLQALRTLRSPDGSATVTVDGVPIYDGPLFLCEVGNGHSVGGGFLLTPDARPDDGRFGVCVVRHLRAARALRLLPTAFSGAHTRFPEVTMAEGADVRIAVAGPGLPVHGDGEGLVADARRVHATVLPGALRVVAPRR